MYGGDGGGGGGRCCRLKLYARQQSRIVKLTISCACQSKLIVVVKKSCARQQN
jgi:hypothetical protein